MNCRLCHGAWSDHGERTGGFYACNRYEVAKQDGVVRGTFDPITNFSWILWSYSWNQLFYALYIVVWWGWEKKRDGEEFFGEIHSLLWTLGKQSNSMQNSFKFTYASFYVVSNSCHVLQYPVVCRWDTWYRIFCFSSLTAFFGIFLKCLYCLFYLLFLCPWKFYDA